MTPSPNTDSLCDGAVCDRRRPRSSRYSIFLTISSITAREFIWIDQSTSKNADCLTIRKPFLEYGAPFSHVVVHRHTITNTQRSLVTHSRIALDTGAYGTGHLTTLIIDPISDSLEFAWTRQLESEITVEFIEPVVTNVPECIPGYFNTISTMQSAR